MDIKNIDLNLLGVFQAVWNQKSISRAAKKVGLSQPAMSAALSRLRESFKDPLFVRSSEGMAPTHRAKEIAEPIHKALDLIRSSLRGDPEAVFQPQGCRREFRVAMSDWMALQVLPPLQKYLRKTAPQTTVTVLDMTPKQMHEALLSSSLDLAITGQENYGSGKYQQTLYHEEYRTIVSSRHSRIQRELTLKQFIEFPHILFSPQGKGLGAVDRALAKKKLKRKIAFRVPYSLAIPVLIQDTDFIATVPRPLAEVFSALAKVEAFMPPVSLSGHDIVQYWNQENHGDPAHRWFRSAIADLCKGFKK